MNSEEKQDGYNEATTEILERVSKLRKETKKSMMVGERNILIGMDIFETAVKALNPEVIDDDLMEMLTQCVDVIIFKERERIGRIDGHIFYGIEMCYSMIHFLNQGKKRKLEV